MSTEDSASNQRTSESDVGVLQEELHLSTESDFTVELVQDSIEDLTESAGAAADALDQPEVTNANTRSTQQNPQEGAAIGGTGIQDSQESPASGDANGSESQQAGVTDSGSGTVLQQAGVTDSGSGTVLQQAGVTDSGSGTVLQQAGETGSIGRQHLQESTAGGNDTESQPGSGNGTEPQLLGAVGGTSRQDSQGSATAGSSSNGDSFETAVAFESSVPASLESGVAGGVSNSTDTQENLDDRTESFEGIAAPAARDEFRENVEVRAQETAELMRGYDQCFSKCACVCDYMRPYSIRIRKSKIFLFLKLLMLVIPISAFCMGLKYLYQCPVRSELPAVVMLMGISGVTLLASSLGLDLRRALCPGVRPLYFKALRATSRVLLLVAFVVDLDFTYRISPSFDPSDQNYCDEVFYKYAYYTNFVVIGIAVLSFFVYVPSCNENMDDYEHL